MVATATAAKKMTGKVNAIGNFFVDKVDEGVMKAFLVAQKIPAEYVDPNVESERLAVALSLYFREQIAQGKLSEDDLAKCAVCGGEGPAEIAGKEIPCAFCGNGETAAEETTSTEQLAAKVAAEEPAPKKKSAKKTPDQPEADTKKEKGNMTATANGTSTAMTTKGKGKGKLSVHEGEVVFTVKDLDAAVARVEQCKVVASLGYWALGHELARINADKLWKLRTTKGGRASYTSFDQFCNDEAKISSTYAYQLIEMTKRFTEADVKKFGPTKLTLMLKVADEDLPKVKEIAGKPGTTKRQLAKEVDKVVKQRGHGAKKSKQHAAAGKKGAKAKAAKTARVSDKITIAAIEGKKKVKLYAKPANVKAIDWKSLKRAKTTAAVPFGKLELTNEVTLYVTVVTTDEGLEAEINVRRDVS